MYLSRITLDARSRDTQRWLADCHAMHRTIMQGFPDLAAEGARAACGVLYRVEDPGSAIVRVLVQSKTAPRWDFDGEAVREVLGPARLDGLESGIETGRRYEFRLRANPTRRVHQRATLGPDPSRGRAHAEPASAAGKRVEIRGEADRVAWLGRQGERLGFRLVDVGLEPVGRDVTATRANPGGLLRGTNRSREQRITLGTALFEGVLEVTDGAAFRQALEDGVGRGKSFGCGLLSIVSKE